MVMSLAVAACAGKEKLVLEMSAIAKVTSKR
jgi:hypothetical protein